MLIGMNEEVRSVHLLSVVAKMMGDKSIEIHISFAPNQSIVNDSHNEDGAQYDIDRTNDETGFDRWPASNN